VGFEFIEGITTADVAFRAYGESIEDLFISSARAVMSVMVGNPEAITREIKRHISLESGDMDLLLFLFLQEVIFYKDSESLLLLPDGLLITHGDPWRLESEMSGDTISRDRHRMRVDIKAVTLHNFEVTHANGLWSATVVLDV
jgi:SHS2 domain-containing protein